jgi:diacylglycerol kinase family enzyme
VETENCEGIPQALAALANQEVDVLALNGGDGTVQQTLTEILGNSLFAHPPLIAPLRGGRTNMSALDIGSRHSPITALSSLIEAARNGSLDKRIVERAVLRVELGPERVVQYGMFFGVGVIHRAIELTHRMFPKGRAQGVFGSGLVLGTLVTRAAFGSVTDLLTPDRMEILMDGQPLEQEEFQLVIATTLERLFLKIRPFWGQEAAPLRFTAIAAGATRSLAAAIGILRGQPPPYVTLDAGYTSRNVYRVELCLDCGLTVDGEMFAPQPGRTVRIEANHRLRFVRT